MIKKGKFNLSSLRAYIKREKGVIANHDSFLIIKLGDQKEKTDVC